MAVSTPSAYEGYSEEIYDGYERTSQYLTMHDGIKVAIDIYRPTKGGVLHEEPLPVIWTATQYRRGVIKPDGQKTSLNENLWFAPNVEMILRHGYIVACLDVRGSGASFGQRSLCNTTDDMEDLYDVCEWLGTRPWCTGKVGMFGCSFLGMSQWMTALMAPPHLTCIVPNVAPIEVPYLITNGVFNTGWMGRLDEGNYARNVTYPAYPVDEDTDGSMLAAAVEDHKKAPSSNDERFNTRYFDGVLPFYNRRVYQEAYLPNFIYKLNSTNIACYIWGGWGDFFAHDIFNWYRTLKTPKKLMVGPWYHTGSLVSQDPCWATEHLRWYDYWLKGIDNGIMDEAPIRMFRCEATNEPKPGAVRKKPDGTEIPPDYYDCGEWHEYIQFPVPGLQDKKYYFHGGRTGSVNSVNDGGLIGYEPREASASDAYVVDYSVTKFEFMDRNYYSVQRPRDFTSMDEKSLTYTSAPLAHDMELTGFPVAHLFVSSTAKDVDFYCYVDDVDEEGHSHQISEGRIRAAVRGTVEPPYDNMGLPFHRNCERDQQEMPVNEVVEIPFALTPLSNLVKAGHRLRITVNNCDKGNWDSPELSPAPTIHMYRDKNHASYVTLPVVQK